MYRKQAKGWLKHWDFILLEIICLQVSYLFAYLARHGMVAFWERNTYLMVAVFLFIAEILVIYFLESFKNVLKRGLYREFAETIKHTIAVILIAVFGLFIIKSGSDVSRTTILYCGIIHVLNSYIVRILYKKFLLSRKNRFGVRSLLIIVSKEDAESVIENISTHNYENFNFSGIVIIDEDMTNESIKGIPVVCKFSKVPEYVCREWVDEVLYFGELTKKRERTVIEKLFETGVTVHISVPNIVKYEENQQIVERVAGQTVITSSLRYATLRQTFLKRAFDIVAGLIGCVVTIFLMIIFGPLIFLSSPGNIFFTQERIGKNGKKFRIIKFRSMYPDAEARKKEYLDQNRNADGMMFKLDFDPRIIGNKITEEGKKKTGIGQFMRAHSIDEFPQFFNVLLGQMSVVGTRPPTPDEWNKYELHHRARLAIKPGITGLWQVSGRSEITNFEEVVKLDREYITNWSMGRDFKIVLLTIVAVFKGTGAI
ncbi:MAG: sugar transferase [Lachnospiraceae bacterium]|nr:sugar transferase [Lachnospiraceae bacterium]